MAPPVLSRRTLEARIQRVYTESAKLSASKLDGPGLAALELDELKRLLPMSALLMEQGGDSRWGIIPHNGVKKGAGGGSTAAQVKLSFDGQHKGNFEEWPTIALSIKEAAFGVLTDRGGKVGANAAALHVGGNAVSLYTVEREDPMANLRLVARGGDGRPGERTVDRGA